MPLALRDDTRIEYSSGNRNAPGDPFGEVILSLSADGRARIDNRIATLHRVWEGRVAQATLQRALVLLDRAGFPRVAAHPIPAGSSLRVVRITSGGEETRNLPIAWHATSSMPEYREAFQLLDSIVVELSQKTLGEDPKLT